MKHNEGRNATNPIEVIEVRPITREDLALLKEPRPKNQIQSFRDAHHNLARFLATGLNLTEAASRAGYSYQRASMLNNDPAFANLVNKYRDKVSEKWLENIDEYQQLAIGNMLKAERQISEKLDRSDEADELLPTRELISISRDAADRFGYGKRDTRVNVNVDFAAKLEAGIARSRNIRVIESSVVTSKDAPPSVPTQGSMPPLAPESSLQPSAPFRRRA